jgi:hypothetical protein
MLPKMSGVCALDETQPKSVGGRNCRGSILSEVAGGLRLGKDSVSLSGEDAMGDKVRGNTP